jgi:hypothetical protein
MQLETNFKFKGEFYSEIVELDGKSFEHIGFRSMDGSFEQLLNTLPERSELPLKASLTIDIEQQ